MAVAHRAGAAGAVSRALELAHRAERFLVPGICLLCRARAGVYPSLCDPCAAELPYRSPGCRRCAAFSPGEPLCASCARRAPPQDATLSVFSYRAPVIEIIHYMKFGGKLEAANLLGALLAHYLRRTVDTLPDLVMPVPLHRGRLRARGFNQALEIARPVARILGITVDPWSVTRVRATRPQAEIESASERRRNVRGAFEVRRKFRAVPYVAVVDDVVTSGATSGELVRKLKQRGVRRVDIWSAAQA